MLFSIIKKVYDFIWLKILHTVIVVILNLDYFQIDQKYTKVFTEKYYLLYKFKKERMLKEGDAEKI